MEQAIVIFTRVPEAGSTKTRLMPHLAPEQCEKLHTCFLKDIRKQCEACCADVFVCYTSQKDSGKQKLMDILGKQMAYFPQVGESLGEKMYRSIQAVLKRGYKKCILIGTDVPELQKNHLERAFEALQEKDVVFGKTQDGGYYLVGMKKPIKEVFELSSYGHSKVFEETLKILRKEHMKIGFTNMLEDMDTPEDLQQYRLRALENPQLQKSETWKYLVRIAKISIVIPTYNEEKTVCKLQKQLESIKEKCEIIFVDGGSTDQTLNLISPVYKVIHETKGRAWQMNAGAKESTGDILFFLHCDSELPANPLQEIREVMKNHRAGCFGVAFHSKNFFMWTCRIISNHRIKDRKVMFGDQGIFIERGLFFEAGMFPEIPIMEDYQFSLKLKEMKVKLGIAKKRIYTSDRRFPAGTIPKLCLMWKMNRLRKMYRDGKDINVIADMYQDIR